MAVAPTYVDYVGDGVTKDFVFPFPYMSASHIYASVGGTITSAFSIFSTSTIRFTTAPAAGALIRVYRETPQTPATTWSDGALILGKDLNAAATQGLYLAQEAFNNAWDALRGNSGPVDGGNATSAYPTLWPEGWRGDKGDTGATGATGATGPQGPQGIQGVAGTNLSGPTQSIYGTPGSYTWTKPAGCRSARIRVVGAGGGSGGILGVSAPAYAQSGGGSSGAVIEGWIDVSSLTTVPVVVGAGGIGGAAGANGGWDGGQSSFGAEVAGGGKGGWATTTSTTSASGAGVDGGTATGTLPNLMRMPGNAGSYWDTGSGASTYRLLGACAPNFGPLSRAPVMTVGDGIAPTLPGQGGGQAAAVSAPGAPSSRAGAAGYNGYVIVEEFY